MTKPYGHDIFINQKSGPKIPMTNKFKKAITYN